MSCRSPAYYFFPARIRPYSLCCFMHRSFAALFSSQSLPPFFGFAHIVLPFTSRQIFRHQKYVVSFLYHGLPFNFRCRSTRAAYAQILNIPLMLGGRSPHHTSTTANRGLSCRVLSPVYQLILRSIPAPPCSSSRRIDLLVCRVW